MSECVVPDGKPILSLKLAVNAGKIIHSANGTAGIAIRAILGNCVYKVFP